MRGMGKLRAIAHQLQEAQRVRRRERWQRRRNPAGQTTPVFLVGNGRSGTSMLVFHLTRSWHISLYNEDNPAAFDQWFLRDLDVIEALVQQSHAPITLFKPIKDTYRTHLLQQRFPQARVLFAFRAFDDVVNSSRKRFYIDFARKQGKTMDEITPPAQRWVADDFAEYAAAPPPLPTKTLIKSLWRPDLNLESNIALHWLFTNSLYFDLGLGDDSRVQLVRYESLVSQPQEAFAEVCRFLQIPFEARMVADVFASSIRKKDPPPLDPAIRAACDALYRRLCAAAAESAALRPAEEGQPA